MTEQLSPRESSDPRFRRGLAFLVLGLALWALVSPALSGDGASPLVGMLLVVAGAAEVLHGLGRTTSAGRRAAWMGGVITVAMGMLLMRAAHAVAIGIVALLAGWFTLDAVRYLVRGVRGDFAGRPRDWVLPAAGNAAVVVLLLLLREWATTWVVALAGALRIAGTGYNILRTPVFSPDQAGGTAIDELGLGAEPELQALGARMAVEEQTRVPIDRDWIAAFLVALFAIHLGRMGFDRTAIGIVAPLVAVLGDVFCAVLIAFGVVIPLHAAWARLTRGAERAAWRWCLGPRSAGVGRFLRRPLRGLLERRLRFAVRLKAARYSTGQALSRGLQIGLPVAAVIAATVPVFGMSWFFDTENWAAGMWNSWAEARTDAWREAMVRAVAADELRRARPIWFSVAPDSLPAGGDFSFIVIGDTGEGDASQHVLRDQLLGAAALPDVRFVVLSSDVVYPTGAMRDYENNFWLPFKGVTKPVYAIPGNHDWYDALEAFTATFLTPAAARRALEARVAADRGLTTTTSARIEALIDRAAFLRQQYGVPTGFQRAPFFDIQTDRFALVAIDTGVAKSIDPVQRRWLEAALQEARGKFIMAVVGHPFYAGGAYQPDDGDAFAELHALLRRHGAAIVMAGDTHDLEYYAEAPAGSDGPLVAHHFVNGGGGAYMSFGTALAWPAAPPTRDWAFYPTTDQVRAKVEANLPAWKRPVWWWTARANAWPFGAEWLSSIFDFNAAPHFQSFVVVHVEPSARRVRIAPVGVHGPLRWSDLQRSSGVPAPGVGLDQPAEWVVPMP